MSKLSFKKGKFLCVFWKSYNLTLYISKIYTFLMFLVINNNYDHHIIRHACTKYFYMYAHTCMYILFWNIVIDINSFYLQESIPDLVPLMFVHLYLYKMSPWKTAWSVQKYLPRNFQWNWGSQVRLFLSSCPGVSTIRSIWAMKRLWAAVLT